MCCRSGCRVIFTYSSSRHCFVCVLYLFTFVFNDFGSQFSPRLFASRALAAPLSCPASALLPLVAADADFSSFYNLIHLRVVPPNFPLPAAAEQRPKMRAAPLFSPFRLPRAAGCNCSGRYSEAIYAQIVYFLRLFLGAEEEISNCVFFRRHRECRGAASSAQTR